jgi:hypothetical protein
MVNLACKPVAMAASRLLSRRRKPPLRELRFTLYSHCMANDFEGKNPATYSMDQGRWERVYLAPPLISPLCWRIRRRRLLVIPTYVRDEEEEDKIYNTYILFFFIL